MQLGKYLAFMEKIIQETTKPSHTKDLLTKKSGRPRPSVETDGQVFGKVMIDQDTLFAKRSILTFRVSDERLLKIYLTHYYSDDKIVCSIKWINTRNTFSMHIVRSLLRYQRGYWFSGKEVDLQPLTLKQFLALYPLQYLDKTRLSRLLPRLFVLSPHNEVICLKSLFLSPKRVYGYRIKELIHTSQLTLKDKDIQSLLARDGIHLSLRTICNCRKLLSIPCYKHRSFHYYGKDIRFSDYVKLAKGQFSRIPSEAGVYELSTVNKIQYGRNRCDVLYIGASKNIQKRLSNYSGSKTKNIRLKLYVNGSDLFVRYFLTKNYVQVEKELLKHFKKTYGELPKANRLGG